MCLSTLNYYLNQSSNGQVCENQLFKIFYFYLETTCFSLKSRRDRAKQGCV